MTATSQQLAHGRRAGTVAAFGAAILFGAGVPLAKLLLGGVSPQLLAGLLYLGAGAALSLYSAIAPRRGDAEASLRASDAPVLAGIVLFGGIIGPLALLVGLSRLSGLSASLLLNLEAPLTMLLAVVVFREHLTRRELAAIALVLLGALALGYRPAALHASAAGIFAVAGACLAWAIDNNLTSRLALRDPIAVTRVKTLAAGATNVAVALAMGAGLPRAATIATSVAVGTLAYGASIVLAMRAMRALGAARQAAYFSTAPFAGALVAVLLLAERPILVDGIATAVMLLGVTLLALARHSHSHAHDPIEHDHRHVHDEHHQHQHAGPSTEPHAHSHKHEPLTHDHPHTSDPHHRHKH